MADDRVHVLICVDSNYTQHLAVCLVSLLYNNEGLNFDIAVVGLKGRSLAESSEEDNRLRTSLVSFNNVDLRLLTFNIPTDIHLPINPDATYTIDAWTRIWIEEFFPHSVERVLYLDSDLVVVGSIAPLWRAELEGSLLGAVDIPGSSRGAEQLGITEADGYFNSGVLLIDLAQWRSTDALGVLLRYVETDGHRLHDPDQDALNACFHHRRKRLAYRWNLIRPFYRVPCPLPLSAEQLAEALRQARIIHYNGRSKPWSYFCDHPRKSEYERYLRMTEWRDYVPPDRTIVNRMRRTASHLLPAAVKRQLKAVILS